MSNPLDRKLIEYDPDTRSGLQFLHDNSADVSGVRQVQHVDAILEANKTLRNNPTFRKNGEEFRRVASIPLVVYNELVRLGITKDRAAFRKWLNDRENRAFRTSEEQV